MSVPAEQPSALTTLTGEVGEKLGRLRAWLDETGHPALVLTQAGPVAWATGGLTCSIERGNPRAPLWLVVTRDRATALTTEVERPRLESEARLAERGLDLAAVPWYDAEAFPAAAEELAGSPRAALAADGAEAFGVDADEDLTALRLALLPPELERLAALGRDASLALEQALLAWRPGERDLDVQARVSHALDLTGATPVCLIVGADDRVERFRHPLAVGAAASSLVMAVVVAERDGLHAAVTRFASARGLSPTVAAAQADAFAVEASVLAASRRGATYGEVVAELARAYERAGHAGAWREHYQGGPVGYRQREFELAPPQTASRWWDEPLAEGHALAWNPSVAGGGKAEDTFVVEASGLRRITDTGDWPLVETAAGIVRPGVLDLATGGPA